MTGIIYILITSSIFTRHLIILGGDIGESNRFKELLFYPNLVLSFSLSFLTRGYFLDKVLKSSKL